MPKYQISCYKRQQKFLRKLIDLITDYEFVEDVWTHSVKCEVILCGIKYRYDPLKDEFLKISEE